MQQSLTTAYHPQGNAYAECIHKFINNVLSQYVNEDQTDWDELVMCLMLAHNDCIHIVNGVSPAEIILGRHLNLPGFEADVESVSNINPRSYAQKLNGFWCKLSKLCKANLLIS